MYNYINEIDNDSIVDRIIKISNNTNVHLYDTPVTVKIELTGVCTLGCVFCFNQIMKKNKIRQKMMSDKEFDICLKYIGKIPTIKEVGLFYMGESTLHPKLVEYYKKVKELGYFTFLTTNGTYIKELIKAIPYIDSLKVSFNYINDKDFSIKTGLPNKVYFDIVDNISILKNECHKQGKKLYGSTVLDYNEQDYLSNEVIKTFDEHYFIPLQNQGGLINKGKGGVVGESKHQVKTIPCWSLFKGLYIDVDLNVRTCCYGHTKEHILFNLRDCNRDLEKLYKIRNQQLSKKIPNICNKCLKI